MSSTRDVIVIDDSDSDMQDLPIQASSSLKRKPSIKPGPLKPQKKKVTFCLNHTNINKQGNNPLIRASIKRNAKRMVKISTPKLKVVKKTNRATPSKLKPLRRIPITNAENRTSSQLLPKHYKMLRDAWAREKRRIDAGLPPSRVRIPEYSDAESTHREYYVYQIQAKKIDADVRDGYIERVEDRHFIQLDDLDPELLTGKPLADAQLAWVKRKQARRAGPPSSLFPPGIRPHDQYTEYIKFTEKARERDPNARACSECGSMLWGTRTLFPLSRPAEASLPPNVMNPGVPLCEGCSRLFGCVTDRSEKMDLIHWLVTGKASRREPPQPSDDALRNVCKSRVQVMQRRARTHFSRLPANFVTAEQLFDSVVSRDMRCDMAGSPLTLSYPKFNSLTFDHRKPISLSMDQPDCWSIDNLVPMSHCMNVVKGNETDKELSRYFLNFIRHYNEDIF
ncbi:hypothetical protein [Parasitella parasitica]|uniref:Uncharacterized protein n=1 Tax=Parasitella parasitica TaxID=35722 RepID=A0A0B7MZ98_9FUNG|nr:hypothetical protein [Parasitella parasitica]